VAAFKMSFFFDIRRYENFSTFPDVVEV